MQPYALCKDFGHPTHICPEIDELKKIMKASNTLVTSNFPKGAKAIPLHSKEVRTSHACTICDKYGHYTHHCPNIPELQKTLKGIIQTMNNESVAPTPSP